MADSVRARREPGGLRHTPAGLGYIALAMAGVMSLHGCATLPNVEAEIAAPRAEQVDFETAQGAVSDARSDAIIGRLEGDVGASDLLEKHLSFEQAVNPTSPLMLGNKLTLLKNGPATYEAMFAAIRTAKYHINLETYIFEDDESGQEFSVLLLQRQAAGVQVNVIHDSVGTLRTPEPFFDRLRAGGIDVLEFNPVNPLKGNKGEWRLNRRDHRRQLIIDGRIAFTGGVNISDTYSRAPSRTGGSGDRGPPANPAEGWRDTHVQVEGPVVAEFQKLFMDTWARQKGEPLAERNYFPELTTQGDEVVRAIGSTPDDPQSQIDLTLMSAIAHAESTIHLTVAYFAPDPQLLTALADAVRRGVDVKLLLPSFSDSGAVFHLGRSFYKELLGDGVEIYELRGAMMHAKTACIDGVWSTIGSTNLDWRSFLHNDEINAVILGRGFATQMETMFADDVRQSDALELVQWKRRSLLSRIKERMARVGAYWL
jgi:cardiolipin synthase